VRLLIDAGNSRIKWAYAEGDSWLHQGALPVEQAEELSQRFQDLNEVHQVWVSNVAGEKVAQLIRNINVVDGVRFNFITALDKQCGVRNGYSNPAQLGSDRWAGLIAAWHLLRKKCMVVNCGTAITIDALSDQGEFFGGVILPGVELMRRSLVAATGQLRPAPGEYAAFPLNTADALFSGTIQACCGAIQRQYSLLKDEGVPVILSGGAADVLKNKINLPLNVVDNLVLQGLLLIAQEADAR
jgi:type III pantothenate kinase